MISPEDKDWQGGRTFESSHLQPQSDLTIGYSYSRVVPPSQCVKDLSAALAPPPRGCRNHDRVELPKVDGDHRATRGFSLPRSKDPESLWLSCYEYLPSRQSRLLFLAVPLTVTISFPLNLSRPCPATFRMQGKGYS